jgi:hypothetical protein
MGNNYPSTYSGNMRFGCQKTKEGSLDPIVPLLRVAKMAIA